ncbi:VanZ family protein [Saccharopolyspora gloriosae]|uniref:VanZ family protein n=1 Tax=Saccharopolyspora gloriosae TaxID=455344 RepID=UPI001FB7824D|nr:VanZ family protein [Saccharopolyspora gloriosae]
MSTRLVPAFIGILVGVLLAAVLFVPYIARQYRRRGELGMGNLALALAAVVYGVSLVAYVLLPFPQLTPDFCATSGMGGPQWLPFNFLNDMKKEATDSSVLATLRNPALMQVMLNVGLFVPLGMFVRHLFGRGVLVTTAIGLGVSLLIEVTQGTGIWFAYPCAYRLFDVDDLIMNTAGALAGAWAAPVLRAVPGQRITALPGAPRPVTRSRRLLAALCDMTAYTMLSALGSSGGLLVLMAAQGMLFHGTAPRTEDIPGSWAAGLFGVWLPWFVLAIVLPLVGSSTSLGQRIVQLKATTADGAAPGTGARLLRSLTGTGGYFLLAQLGDASADVPALEACSSLAQLLALVSLIGLFTTAQHRGLSYKFAGLRIADARTDLEQTELVKNPQN